MGSGCLTSRCSTTPGDSREHSVGPRRRLRVGVCLIVDSRPEAGDCGHSPPVDSLGGRRAFGCRRCGGGGEGGGGLAGGGGGGGGGGCVSAAPPGGPGAGAGAG